MLIEDVYKRFERHGPWVINGVNLAFEAGTGTFVTGTNGSGKSTLLRIVAGLTRPTRGQVERARTASYVPERQPESIRMTGSAYLLHLGRMRGLGPIAIESKVSDLVGRLGLEPGPDVPIEELSKGNRQKVLVAQAFLCPEQLIVMDEPFSGLDSAGERALGELLAEALNAGSAIVVSGHEHASKWLDTYKSYQLVDGRAIERTKKRRSTSGEMTVTLVDKGSRLDRKALDSIPGVVINSASVDHGQDGRLPLVAHVDHNHTDRFLVEAISAGWSVVRVEMVDQDGRDESSS